MNIKEITEKLVKEAESNAASNALFHVFALRKRARASISLNSLYHKMKLEGFTYDKSDYIPAIKLLSDLGLGVLDFNSKGGIRGLKNIRVTLQSIGSLACKQKVFIKNFTSRNKFSKLVEKPEIIKLEAPAAIKKTDLSLEFHINGKSIYIPVPKDLTNEEIALLVNKLH